MTLVFGFLLIILTLAISGIFAAYEMALASIAASRLHVLAAKSMRGSEDALFMKGNMEASLAVTQLGITLTGAVAAAAGGVGVSDFLSPVLVDKWHLPRMGADIVSLFVLVIPLSALTIIGAELVPKMIALKDRERVCLGLSPLMRKLFGVFYPVVRIFERAVKVIVRWILPARAVEPGGEDPGLHELQAAAALARTSRLIGAHQEKIVLSAAQLSRKPVRDIFIPIQEVSTIPLSATLSQALVRAHMDMHTRFPVVDKEEDPQTVVGYINFKDIIAALKLNPADPSVRGIIRPLKRIEADVSVSHALETMMHEKLHIALITGRGGRVTGLVTLEDIIEELVGEIEDEFDRLPTHSHPFAGGWIMGGGLPMTVVAQHAGVAFTGSTEGRLADWCASHGQDVNKGGEIIEADGIRVTARKFRRKKVSEAAVSTSLV